jgi:hypothetical protein
MRENLAGPRLGGCYAKQFLHCRPLVTELPFCQKLRYFFLGAVKDASHRRAFFV